MSAIKDGRYPILLDKERHLLFSLNALDEMQDKFGGIDKLSEIIRGKDNLKNIRWLLTLLINEGADDGEDPLTEKQVGKLIHTGNLLNIQNDIFKSFSIGNNGDTQVQKDTEEEEPEDENDEEKNAQSGQEK